MALKQAAGLLLAYAPILHSANAIVAKEWTADISSAGLLAADLLEIGCLPAGCRLHRAEFTSYGIGATATVDVGLLSGEFGTIDDSRTMAATGEIIEAGTDDTTIPVGPYALRGIAKSNTDRGIGVRLSATEAAGASTGFHLYIEYYRA